MQKDNGKKLGSIEILSSLMLLCLTGLILLFGMKSREVKIYQKSIKDSLDLACLSAAVIDTDYYEETGDIRINNISVSMNNFLDSLKTNMDLDNSLAPNHQGDIGKVTVHALYIFNITGIHNYEIYSMNSDNASYTRYVDGYDSDYTTTPDGKKIVTSTVYADIGMNIKGMFGEPAMVPE